VSRLAFAGVYNTTRMDPESHAVSIVGSRARAFILIFAVTVAVRLFLLSVLVPEQIMWAGEVERIALNLASTGEFANPYAAPTGTTAHNPPGLPFVFSLLFRTFGDGSVGFTAKVLLVVICYGLLYGLLPTAAASIGLPVQAGVLAGLIGAIIPFRRAGELYLGWEEPIAALFLMALLILTLRARAGRLPFVAAAGYGALWGVTFHFAPALLPVFLAFLLFMIWRPVARRRSVQWCAVAVLTCMAVILPWTLRNHRQLGAWMFMRSNFGLELRVSYNDFVSAAAVHNNDIYNLFHPGFNADIARELAAEGEVAFHRRSMGEAIAWIRENPSRTANLILLRFVAFWAGPPVNSLTTYATIAVTIAGFAGLILLLRRHHYVGALFGLVWLSYPALYYLIQANPRYRAPIDWTVLLAAAFATLAAVEALRSKKVPTLEHKTTTEVGR
jgi:hypothetical protein